MYILLCVLPSLNKGFTYLLTYLLTANPGLKFILRLDSVPESTINTNLGIKEGLNLST